MTPEQGEALLKALNVKNISKNGEWLQASCPLAPWLHASHKDTSPSFGLLVDETEASRFHCFACKSGSAEELVGAIDLWTRDDPQRSLYDFAAAHQILAAEELVVPALPEFKEFGNTAAQAFQPWMDTWIDSFVPATQAEYAMAYLQKRNVSLDTIQQFNLRFDSSRNMIVCPYRNVYGRLAGARGRSILDGVEGKDKHYDYTWKKINNAGLVWYNEPVLNLSGPVVVVEGQFDVWRTQQAYLKVVGNLTAKPTEIKLAKLCQSDKVIHIPDRDKAGEESMERYAKFCAQHKLPYVPVQLDAGVKDPDDCHPDYLRDKILSVI